MNKLPRLRKSEKYLFLGILLVGILLSAIVYKSNLDGITRSTVHREKLKTKEKFDKDCVETDTEYLSDVQHTAETLKAFYKETGVQPYVLVVGKQGFGVESATETWLKEHKLGSNDMLLVYERIEAKKGISYIKVGSNASKVMDTQAQEILIDYLEYYVNEIPALDASITKAFYDTSEDIMGKPDIPVYVAPLFIMIVVIIVLIGLYVQVVVNGRKEKLKKRKTRVDERKYRGY